MDRKRTGGGQTCKKAFLAPHDSIWQKFTVRTTVHINIHRCVMSDWAYMLLRYCQYSQILSNGLTEITFCFGVTGVTHMKIKIPILSAEIILLFPKIIASNMLSFSVLRKSDVFKVF